MEECERRQAHRYAIRIPLAFRPLKPNGFARCSGEMIDLSTDGVRFISDTALSRGALVKVYLKLPRNVIGRPSPEWGWMGKVIHIRTIERKKCELGVQFLCCDITPPAERESVDE